ncbi:MAG TPA: sulfatase-like hydrolase/transferase, partial [Draconibacterium sp.]|nr:sulfatase-like hydrolase/transferase [Draconibacterium sp.]
MNNYRSLAVCVLTSLVIPANAGNKIENVKPNVLFIAVDDLRPNLGCYGDPIAISPNIDKLASQGIVFTHAYCQEALCSPSRTSLLTGRRPDEIGVVDQGTHFRVKHPNVITLPQLFKLNGYHSISIGKIFHFKKG